MDLQRGCSCEQPLFALIALFSWGLIFFVIVVFYSDGIFQIKKIAIFSFNLNQFRFGTIIR